MNPNDTIRQIAEMVVDDQHSSEIIEIVDALPGNHEDAAAAFCDRYELGNWFYDAMILNDYDIREQLIDISNKKMVEELLEKEQ